MFNNLFKKDETGDIYCLSSCNFSRFVFDLLFPTNSIGIRSIKQVLANRSWPWGLWEEGNSLTTKSWVGGGSGSRSLLVKIVLHS
jgi:hypothetical protein